MIARISPGDGDPRHGTFNGYSNLQCRCDLCRRSWADYRRDYGHKRGWHVPRADYLSALRADPPPHGTLSRYGKHHKCRCAKCREAARVYQADYRRHKATE